MAATLVRSSMSVDKPNKAIQMETQCVPAYQAADANGVTYARIAPTSFPRTASGDSLVIHRLSAYQKSALWDSVESWFSGGPVASGRIDPDAAAVHTFSDKGGSTWKIYAPSTAKEKKVPLRWDTFASPIAIDSTSYGYRWNESLTKMTESNGGAFVTLPEYLRLQTDDPEKPVWVVVAGDEVPAETGLAKVVFGEPKKKPSPPYITPDDPASCWKTPGPVAGPFQANLGDGSVGTYYWYRFADQPALLNADLTDEEREQMQRKVEKLHRETIPGVYCRGILIVRRDLLGRVNQAQRGFYPGR